MKLQDQWLFESLSTPKNNDQNWSWEQDFAEVPPAGSNKNRSIFSRITEKVAPYAMPVMMGVSGVEAAQQSNSPSRADTPIVSQPPSPKVADARKAFKAAVEAERKRRKTKKKPEISGGFPPSVKIRLPTFTGYPRPPLTVRMPAKNRAGFFTREAEANSLQGTWNEQSQRLFEAPLAPNVRNLGSHYSSTKYKNDVLFEAPLRSDADYMAATEGVEIRLRQNLFTGRESHDQQEILKLADQPSPGTRYEALVRRRFGNLGGKLKLRTTESDAWRNEQEGGSLIKTPVEITIHRKWNSRKRLQITEALLTKHRVTVITPSRNRASAMAALKSIGSQVKALLRRRHGKTSNLTITLVLT
jgi:hypothetical protein